VEQPSVSSYQPPKKGSGPQSVKVCILRGFLESDELGLGGWQALRLQQQVTEIAVAPTLAYELVGAMKKG
jgi:hypothetical protein